MLVDSHAHIYSEYYDNIDSIIKESLDNNVNIIINNGVDSKTNKEVLKLISKYPNMYGTLGIHPEYQDEYNDKDIEFIKDNIFNKKIVAIGEIGLDYHYDNYNKQKQIELFEKQLKLAESLNIPVVVHSRDATLDTLNTIKKYKVKGVIHSFSGSYEIGKEYIKLGFVLGVNGVVTFKNAKYIDTIKKLGIENYILETDSPYLTPEPFRGKINSPKNTIYVAKFISEKLNISLEKISEITNKNVARIFDIDTQK